MNGQVFDRILLAIDRSPQSANAVSVVAGLGPPGAAVRVVHVWNLEVRDHAGTWSIESISSARQLVEKAVATLNAAGLQAQGEVRSAKSTHVARVIVEAADAFAADLIAMGSRGRSDLGGLFLGSVSRDVLEATSRPVLMVRAIPPARRRVLVAIAGADEVPTAVATTIAVARRWQAEAIVVHVAGIAALARAIRTSAGEDGAAIVDEAVARLRSAGVDARGLVIDAHGSVASQIASQVEAIGADLIVVGSRRPGELRSLLLGSTDHALRHQVETPVLVAERID